MRKATRLRFDGWIAGAGTASGTRMVLGHWERSPFGAFSDVMVEHGDGTRLLLAPTEQTADFISSTYAFDGVHIHPVAVAQAVTHWSVTAGPLVWHFTTGARGALGQLLRSVPATAATHPLWIRCADLPARLLGLRTHGSVQAGRRQFYGARDLLPVTESEARWQGADLGRIAAVEPPVRFGSASVPRRPALVRVSTTVELAGRRRRTAGATPCGDGR
ncbi:hypothetical protein ACFZB6_06375 [Streptomyces syringium]|uniref:hypothetical protein n=1 Tax=Streptomyces syringium TaxID=76729 RepID=UPI0033D5A335